MLDDDETEIPMPTVSKMLNPSIVTYDRPEIEIPVVLLLTVTVPPEAAW